LTNDRRLISWLIGFAVFAALLFMLSGVLTPFVAGMAVAYFFDPVAEKLHSWGCSRGVAAGLIIAAFFVIAFGGLILLIPLLQGQVVGLASKIPGLIDAARTQAEPLIHRLQADMTPEATERLRVAAGDYAGDLIKWFTGVLARMWSGGVAFFQLMSLVVITPVAAFYLLRDWNIIVGRVDSWLPRNSAPTIRRQLSEIDKTIAGFVRGQATVCLALAIFYSIGLTLAGLPFGLLVGVGAGLISFIPYVGALIGFLTGVGIALAQFQDWLPVALTAGVFFIGQITESYFLTPKLVGDRIGLHPVWIIFALLAGGALFGFTGVMLAIPAAAIIGVLARFSIDQYRESGLFHGGDGGS